VNIRTKALALAAGVTLLAGLAVTAGTASATTLTCTGIANQVTPPLGCGGATLAYQAKGTLDLAVLGGNYWNSHVGFLGDSTGATAEDLTVFAVDGSVTDGPGGLGEYVAVYTPDGKFASFTQGGVRYADAVPAPGPFTVGTDVYAVSVEQLANGPRGAERWNTVLRNANSNGTFTYGETLTAPSLGASGTTYTNTYDNVVNVSFTGTSTVTGLSVTGSGVSGNGPSWAVAPHTTFTVTWTSGTPTGWTWQSDNSVSASFANRYQVWAPVQGSAGLELINESLSGGFRHGGTGNTPYVLDDRGNGGSGTWGLAYPENDGLNQQFTIVGCTEPITGLNTGYQLCP